MEVKSRIQPQCPAPPAAAETQCRKLCVMDFDTSITKVTAGPNNWLLKSCFPLGLRRKQFLYTKTLVSPWLN